MLINLTVSGGTSPYTYSWSNGATTEDITGLAAGDYTVTITDANGCTTSLPVTVETDVSTITVTPVITNTTCTASIGAINLTVSGGTAPYTYSWSNGATTEDITGLAAGDYTVTITDANGCTTSKPVTVETDVSTITVTPVITNTTCTASIGAINLTVSGGTAPYTYSWSNGATTEDITGLAAGDYTVTITDANGCTTSKPVTVETDVSTITVTPVITNTTCTASIGAINLTVSGGTAPYTYSWSNGATTEDITGLAAGDYTVTITDANGCTTSKPVTVGSDNVNFTVTPVVTNTTCTASIGAIALIVSGGTAPYTYLWNNGATTPNINGLAAGTYTLTITDVNGCTTNKPFTVGSNNITVTTTVDTVLCANLLPFIWNNINVNAAGVYPFTTQNALGCDSITRLNVAIKLITRSVTRDSTCANQPFVWNGNSYTTSGTYTSTLVNAAGCDSIATLILLVKPIPPFVIHNPQAVCEPLTINLTDPSITSGSDPGLTYTYWMDSLATIPLSNPGAVGVSGSYYIKAQGVDNCTPTKPVAVIVTIKDSIGGARYPTVIAQEFTPAQLSARNIGVSYNWSPPSGLNFSTIKDPVFNFNSETQYIIDITRENGCITTDTVLVKIVAAPPAGLPKSDLFVPKAWTPNNDGHNDKLYPLTVNIRELRYFRVFNRWGQLVFETNAIGTGWDGMFNGKPQVMDAYTWTAEAIGTDGKTIKKSGSSVLIR